MSNGTRLVGAAGALTAVGILCVAVVAKHEGLRTAAYRDPVGIPTVCFGETRGVKMGDKYTVAQCKDMLGKRLMEFEDGVERCIKNPAAIPDKSWVVFISFAYNVGTGAFCKSSVARKANAGDLRGACDALLAWTKAGGRTLKGLVTRRQQERKLCLEGLSEGWGKDKI